MQVFHDLKNLPKFSQPVLTLGIFDGVHEGHQLLINTVIQKAKEIHGTSIIITYDPHPKVFFNKDVVMLETLEERLRKFQNLGVDVVIICTFTKEFSQISAEDFVEMLVESISPSWIILGYDHHFGREGKGNYALLETLGEKYNFSTEQIGPLKKDGEIISSTSLRATKQQSEL